MLIFKIAFRNIFRQRRRSLFTALTMIGGFVLFSLALSISEGTYGTVIEKFTSSYTGHIQIHRSGYYEKPTIYKTLDNFESIQSKLLPIKAVKAFAPRIYAQALGSKDKKTSIAKIIGIDPELEPKTTSIKEKIKLGTFLNTSNEVINEVMIGQALAEILNLKIGDDFVLVGQGVDGSIANDLFHVKAILKGDNFSIDRNFCYMSIKSAQKFLSLETRIHEVAIVLDDYKNSVPKALEIDHYFKNSNEEVKIEVLPWEIVEKQFYNTMVFEKRGMKICLFIIVIIVAIGVLNTVLMSILERTVEYGVLKALGTRPFIVFNLIILESAILSAISITIGFIISFIVNYWVSIHGIEYPSPMEIGGFTITTMYGYIYAGAFVLPAVVTFFTAVFVSVIPAYRAMKIEPIEAMRMN